MSATALCQKPIGDLDLPRTKKPRRSRCPRPTPSAGPRTKAAVVEAVHSSRITIEEVCHRYALSVEEFLSWHNTIQRHGVQGLQITKLPNYRYARPKTD
jgi:hypothetical protein